jgi:hypothetical protein
MTETESSARHMSDPGIVDGEQTTYRVDIGHRRAAGWITHVVVCEENEYRTETVGEFDDVTVHIDQCFRRAHSTIAADRYNATTTNGHAVVSREEANFIDTRHLHFGGKIGPFPSELVPLAGGLTLLRGLDFRRGHSRTVDLWLGFSVTWPVEVRVAKKEKTVISGTSHEVWTVKVRPSFKKINSLLDKIVSGILPEFVLHFAAADAHRLLAMSFPTGPLPWDPRGRFELDDDRPSPIGMPPSSEPHDPCPSK